VFLLLLFITRMKLAMLLGWIISIIAIDTYLIVVEYLRERYANYLGEEAMSAEEFRSAIPEQSFLIKTKNRNGLLNAAVATLDY